MNPCCSSDPITRGTSVCPHSDTFSLTSMMTTSPIVRVVISDHGIDDRPQKAGIRCSIACREWQVDPHYTLAMPLNITMLFGSYRRDRIGIRVVRFVERRLTARGHAVTLVDAREIGLPI